MHDAPASLPPGLLLKRALDQAAVLHADQVRKYPGVRVPYMSHLAGVVSILARQVFAFVAFQVEVHTS